MCFIQYRCSVVQWVESQTYNVDSPGKNPQFAMEVCWGAFNQSLPLILTCLIMGGYKGREVNDGSLFGFH